MSTLAPLALGLVIYTNVAVLAQIPRLHAKPVVNKAFMAKLLEQYSLYKARNFALSDYRLALRFYFTLLMREVNYG